MKPQTLEAYPLDEIVIEEFDDFHENIICECMSIDIGGAEYALINLQNIINGLNHAIREGQDHFCPQMHLDDINSFLEKNELNPEDVLVIIQ